MKTTSDFPNINERVPDGKKDDGQGFRVLVVDDSMFVTKQIGQILTSEGFEVVATAADGQEHVPGGHAAEHGALLPVGGLDGLAEVQGGRAIDTNAALF